METWASSWMIIHLPVIAFDLSYNTFNISPTCVSSFPFNCITQLSFSLNGPLNILSKTGDESPSMQRCTWNCCSPTCKIWSLFFQGLLKSILRFFFSFHTVDNLWHQYKNYKQILNGLLFTLDIKIYLLKVNKAKHFTIINRNIILTKSG